MSRAGAIAAGFLLAGAAFSLPAAAEDDALPVAMALEGPVDDRTRRDEDPVPVRLEYPQQEPPPRRPAAQRGSQLPYVDWARFETSVIAGFTLFSGDFEADPTWCAGLQVRVPVPGLPLRKWGVFAEGIFSNMDRDLPSYYDDTSGSFFVMAGGADYTLSKNDVAYLRGQIGLLFASYGDINGVDDGMGALLGLSGGVFWNRRNKNISFSYNPQFAWDTEDWIMFHTVGLNVDF